MNEFKILSPTAILGYGFPEESFRRGMAMKPDLIAVDGGSTDPGPYYLGSGKPFTDRTGVKRDLRFMITAGVEAGIPVMVGTSGGSGAAEHLAWCREIVEEIAAEEGLSFKLGLIPADVSKATVLEALEAGEIRALDYVPELTREAVEETPRIVAQMGIEPFIDALDKGCDVILAGRAYDPAVFAALPVKLGYDEGLAVHMGKILECAAIAAMPGSGADSVMGILKEDCFELETLSDDRRFTRESTVAHSLYEKSDPMFLPGPGGRLNLSACTFEEVEGNRVRVRGSKHENDDVAYLKLEGARCVGYRTITIAGTHDPIMIEGLDRILADVRTRVSATLEAEGIHGDMHIHVYGKDGVMGGLEPDPHARGAKEVGILIEAVGPTQDEANSICSITRSTLLHYGYDGRVSTAGNLAFPFSPSDIKAGEVYEFSLYHLIPASRVSFPVEVVHVNGTGGKKGGAK